MTPATFLDTHDNVLIPRRVLEHQTKHQPPITAQPAESKLTAAQRLKTNHRQTSPPSAAPSKWLSKVLEQQRETITIPNFQGWCNKHHRYHLYHPFTSNDGDPSPAQHTITNATQTALLPSLPAKKNSSKERLSHSSSR